VPEISSIVKWSCRDADQEEEIGLDGADPGDVGRGFAEGAHVVSLIDAEGVYDSPFFLSGGVKVRGWDEKWGTNQELKNKKKEPRT
jgi:hypothetical protein